jgi:flagellar motor component MotA
VVKKGKMLKKGKVLKMLKKVNKKRRKKGILKVSRHLEDMLSLVLLMREKKTQR